MDSIKFVYLDPAEFTALGKQREDVSNLIAGANSWAKQNRLHVPNYDDNSCILVAVQGGKYLGFIQYYGFCTDMPIADECYISWIYVPEQYRKQGIAKAMIKELQSFMQTLPDTECITSAVLKENVASQKLHRSLGFKDTESLSFSIDTELRNRLDLLKWETGNGIS